jgi:ATP-dependent DNA ligase
MLYGFDLIELNGVNLRRRPLLDRKAVLQRSPPFGLLALSP